MNLLEYKKQAAKKLSTISDTPQLEAELLMMHALQLSRATLLTHSHHELSQAELKKINYFVSRRLKDEPIAYLLEIQPFWTMDLIVSTDTLIPRPETECLVDWILHHYQDSEKLLLADLGTGTGAISIALATERKQWHIDAVDESAEALAIAKKNIDQYAVKNVSLYVSDWCEQLPKKNYDIIVSNPPYIAENDAHLKKLQFEPQSALVSGKDGLDAIKKITAQAKDFLINDGYLIIEHGFDQAEKVVQLFEQANYCDVQSHRDLSDVSRFVTGKKM